MQKKSERNFIIVHSIKLFIKEHLIILPGQNFSILVKLVIFAHLSPPLVKIHISPSYQQYYIYWFKISNIYIILWQAVSSTQRSISNHWQTVSCTRGRRYPALFVYHSIFKNERQHSSQWLQQFKSILSVGANKDDGK
jgi:hypothetical protein